jgi:hypothetical protein
MPEPIKIEHRIGVQTPAEPIWELISDINGWGRWNPIYPKAEGKVGFGEHLTLEVAIPGEARRTIHPVMFDWTPNAQILWNVKLFGGLIQTMRYIEIETLDNGNCIFSNGEMFKGPLAFLLGRKQRRAIKAGFVAMGETVRDKVEAAWKREHPEAISSV